ncbi:MAG: tyrosine/phenylalanine carboxypeptidase domain-containing protein [Ktedonobacteraceae bacterium]
MVLSQPSRDYPVPQVVFRLSALSAYSTWGELLAGIRKHNNITQQEIAKASDVHFIKAGVPMLRPRIYGDMERGRRAPYYKEMEPLFRTFIDVCRDEISDVEITTYVHLAKERMAQKSKRIERVDDPQWEALTETLFHINNSKRNRKIYLIKDEPASEHHIITEDPESRRRKAIDQALHTDTSHLLEREEWVAKMLTYPEATPQRKLVVIQGYMGTGKSHALALLTQHLAKESKYYLIPYLFEAGESKTPEDHLEVFLATIFSDLTMTATSDDVKQRPLKERIDQVLAALKERGEQGQKVMLLLDDAQVIFPSAAEWFPAWAQFFEAVVREQHTATLYMMTRTWPGWEDRRLALAYIEETELPELSAGASVTMWRRKGFEDVPEDLLRKVSHRYGYNPQLIEMIISQCKKQSWSFAWRKEGEVSARVQKSPHTQRLEDLLAQETIFDPRMDVKAHMVLQHSLTSRLSHQAMQMLECLALSPLGLPFTLLIEEFARAKDALYELASASAVDLNAAASQRAAIVPLVREAQWQLLLHDGRWESIDQRVTDLYAYWLTTLQDFRDDAEKAGLIAEMIVRYIRQRQLLKAAELFISYGWLCVLFGHVTRIQRVFDEVVKEDRGKEEDVRHEVGRLLLQHRIAVSSRQPFERTERDRIYQSTYEKVVAGKVELQPHSELEVLHNMLLFYNRSGQLAEAKQVFDQTLARLQQSGQMTPEAYASFLFDKARLMSYCADSEKQLEASLRFTQASVDCVTESIANWRLCLKNTLPLQETYIQFKLARTLNDLACDLRTLRHYTDAQAAIEESIELKKKSGALPHSIAVALSEYSQILAAQGKFLQGSSINEEAKKILEASIAGGDDIHKPELGLILKERADILWQQARLQQAKPLLEQAVKLMADKPLRQKDKERANTRIKEIELILSSSRPYQLDRRWFTRFSDLISYNDAKMLIQAGPFTEEESIEWNRLASQEDAQSRAGMSKLIALSRKREFTRSREEICEPIIHYPHLSLNDVRNRMSGLTVLRQEIEAQESNMVVCRLYRDAIDDHFTLLHLCEATALQDQTTAMQCNLQLYGKPSELEFKIALQQLCSMLFEARTHKLAGSVALEALTQLQEWGISPQEIVDEYLFIPMFDAIPQQTNPKLLASEKRTFSTNTICKFFRDVLAMYGENDWNVYVEPARDHTSVDPDIRELILPEKSFSVQKVRQLLAEEIEVHSFRAIAGRNSPLALLGSGLANHLAIDEGLAYHYVQSVSRQVYGRYEEKKWNATLTTGFVSGVLTPALSFPELRNFLEKMFLVSELLNDETWEDAFEFARQAAWRRCCRVFRGAGCLSLKDRVYLQGHLEVSNYLARGGEIQRLYVGCIGIEHLEDMAELAILTPNYPHQQLALATDLAERLGSYER